MPYEMWLRVGIFRHGKMIEASYSRGIFQSHMASIAAHTRSHPNSLLELGPGDSVATAIWARAQSIHRTTLVDAGRFVTSEVDAYREALKLAGLENDQAGRASTLDEMLRLLGATYLCTGLAGLKSIPGESVDVMFSNAVLEHVRRSEFSETMRELYRIQRAGGVSSHQIDLRDHLGGALNSLRISHERWESPLFSQSGFYTNRLRCSEICSICADAGWEILECTERRWAQLATPRSVLHADFQHLSDDDLLVSGVRLVIRRPGAD
jgi:hypothetical protein